MTDTRSRWEGRYATAHGIDAAPSRFLLEHAALIHGRALDVAAGRGRNTLFLARRGITVDAIDISFAALRTLHATAVTEHLRVQAVQADLESFPLPRNRYDALINVRYLQRSLFHGLREAVKPGGIILFETFLIDQRLIGHPSNPEYLLERGELRAAFTDWEIVHYAEGLLEEPRQRAYLARLVARRPSKRD